ncbi:hypothetical protein [Streptomyces sp. YIM 98790]|uniref:hypothetical protein n=1 Tax=Streptomyces sp. YIM 98790 TaxID=2689077 RepID=UPI001407F1F4|nr:hypothetical protein [Streptomyces sp. YIM 98790]
MTRACDPSPAQVHAAAAAEQLYRPWIVRVVSELSDAGPIHRRQLAAALPDLSATTRDYAMGIAARHRLLLYTEATTPSAYVLTDAGEELADFYHAAARWARTHHYPAQESTFVSRAGATVWLLSDPEVHLLLGHSTTTLPLGLGRRLDRPATEQTNSLVTSRVAQPHPEGGWELGPAGAALRAVATSLQNWAAAHHTVPPIPPQVAAARRTAPATSPPQAVSLRRAA